MNERDSEHFDRALSCKTCRWFDPSFAPDEDEHEALGLCE